MGESEREIVLAARDGDLVAFERLVIRYRGRAYGLARRAFGEHEIAEEVAQETFLRAFTHLRRLRDPGRFGAWVFRICRNQIADRARREAAIREVPLEPMARVLDDPRAAAEWDGYTDLVRVSVGMLPPRLRDVLRLRCFAGLSYGEIAALSGVTPARVKSRLHEARERLRERIPLLHQGLDSAPGVDGPARRYTMAVVQMTRDGAYVMERLSLARQVELCRGVQSGGTFPASVLAAAGEVDRGVAFVEACHGTLNLAELIDILNYVDQGTERRIVDELDRLDPAFAETIKQNMFVFEDLVLFDHPAIRALFARVKEIDMLRGLASTIPTVRDHILAALPEAERSSWLARIQATEPQGTATSAARFTVVDECRKMDGDRTITGSRAADGTWRFTAVE